jgi:hypothetical protein
MARIDTFASFFINKFWSWRQVKSRCRLECVFSRKLGVIFEKKVRFEGQHLLLPRSLVHAFLTHPHSPHFSIVFSHLMTTPVAPLPTWEGSGGTRTLPASRVMLRVWAAPHTQSCVSQWALMGGAWCGQWCSGSVVCILSLGSDVAANGSRKSFVGVRVATPVWESGLWARAWYS